MHAFSHLRDGELRRFLFHQVHDYLEKHPMHVPGAHQGPIRLQVAVQVANRVFPRPTAAMVAQATQFGGQA
jgi:hypothetical protein